MSYRPKPKGASTDPRNPRSWATCDRTGFVLNHYKLAWQSEWAGNNLINTGNLVRAKSLDKPQPQFRSLNLPPDPAPIMNARVEQYTIEETNPASTQVSVALALGSTTVFVLSVTGFSAGSRVYIYLDGGTFALVTIGWVDSTSNSMGFYPPLTGTAAINQMVVASGATDVSPITYPYIPTFEFLGF